MGKMKSRIDLVIMQRRKKPGKYCWGTLYYTRSKG